MSVSTPTRCVLLSSVDPTSRRPNVKDGAKDGRLILTRAGLCGADCDPVVPCTGGAAGCHSLLHPRRHVVGGLHLRGDGSQVPSVPGRLGAAAAAAYLQVRHNPSATTCLWDLQFLASLARPSAEVGKQEAEAGGAATTGGNGRGGVTVLQDAGHTERERVAWGVQAARLARVPAVAAAGPGQVHPGARRGRHRFDAGATCDTHPSQPAQPLHVAPPFPKSVAERLTHTTLN